MQFIVFRSYYGMNYFIVFRNTRNFCYYLFVTNQSATESFQFKLHSAYLLRYKFRKFEWEIANFPNKYYFLLLEIVFVDIYIEVYFQESCLKILSFIIFAIFRLRISLKLKALERNRSKLFILRNFSIRKVFEINSLHFSPESLTFPTLIYF